MKTKWCQKPTIYVPCLSARNFPHSKVFFALGQSQRKESCCQMRQLRLQGVATTCQLVMVPVRWCRLSVLKILHFPVGGGVLRCGFVLVGCALRQMAFLLSFSGKSILGRLHKAEGKAVERRGCELTCGPKLFQAKFKLLFHQTDGKLITLCL